MRNLKYLLLGAAFAVMASLGSAGAQDYPNKPVKIVVPYTPGGPADLLVRGLGEKLQEKWGQPVVVENRAGGNEIVAATAVAQARPDGYTFLLASDAVFSLNTYLYSQLPYDAEKNFTPVTRLVTANLMLVTRPDFPANTLKEFIDYAKQNPGKINYGSVGAGGVNHLAMSWFNNIHGLQMNHIPYKGLAQALQDVVAGRVDTMFAVIGGARPFVSSGQLKGLAVSGRSRSSVIPNVPTFAELGETSFEASFYFGVAAPSGTPADIAAKFAAEASRIVNAPEFKDKYLLNLGFEPVGDTPEQFAAFLKTDRQLAAEKVKVSGAKLD